MNGSALYGDGAYLLLFLGALFVHACYQLSVSVLTYMSSHSLSKKLSTRRLLWLGLSYTAGVIATTVLLLVSVASLTTYGREVGVGISGDVAMLSAAVLVPLVGLATVFWYYRRGDGTQIWLPRPLAIYLLKRSKKTRSAVEAFALGAMTVVGELPFLIAPIVLVAAVVGTQPSVTWIAYAGAYAFVASLPLIVVTFYLTSGHSVSGVQRWREKNKVFLQWTSGIALILLTFYLVVLQIGVLV